jgi:hypothetical protein
LHVFFDKILLGQLIFKRLEFVKFRTTAQRASPVRHKREKLLAPKEIKSIFAFHHGLRTPGEEIAFTAQPKKSTPTPKFLGTAKAYFVCHIGPNFQIFFFIYAFIGCP